MNENEQMSVVLGTVAMEPKGDYSSEVYYEKLNIVLYNGSTYIAKQPSLDIPPTNANYWQFISSSGLSESDVIDSLDSTLTTKPLSANQGRVLNEKNTKMEYIFPKFMPDARSGSCAIIKYKDKIVMIDSYHSDQWAEIKAMLDDNNITNIDYFILTHYHIDHYGNFKNLVSNGYINSTTKLYMPSNLTQISWVNTLINEYSSYCNEHDLVYYVPAENEVLIIDDLKLTFYNTDATILYQKYYDGVTNPDYNNTSTVILVEYGQISSLFTGDASRLAYQRLREDNFVKGKLDFYTVGHHGINMPTDIKFIENIKPSFAYMPSGIIDFTRHNLSISQETYLLRRFNTTVYNSCTNEDYIRFIIDGESIKCSSGEPSNPAIWKITHDIYVDKQASTSTIQDGTQEHPYSEIMQAINSINYEDNCDVNIYLADGDYGHPHSGEVNKNRLFIRTGRKCKIIINGNSANRKAVKFPGIQIENSVCLLQNLYIDMDLSSTVNAGIYAYNSDIFLNNVVIDSDTDTPSSNACVMGAYNSNIAIFGSSYLNNGNYAVRIFGGSLFLDSMKFGTFTSGLVSATRTPYYTNNITFDNSTDKTSFKYHNITETPKLLFSGQNNSSVDCYDNISNYDWIEIFGATDDNVPFSSGKIWNPSSRDLTLNCSFVTAGGGYRIKSCLGTITNNIITLTRQTQFDITSAGVVSVSTTSGHLDVRRVIGGKNDYQDIR